MCEQVLNERRGGAVEVGAQTRATVSRYRSHNRIREEIDPGLCAPSPGQITAAAFSLFGN